MKKRLLYATLSAAISLLVIASLHFISQPSHLQSNNFTRLPRKDFARLQSVKELPSDRYHIVGVTGKITYLSLERLPFTLLIRNNITNEIIEQKIQNNTRQSINAGLLRVDSPWIYLLDPNTNSLFGGSLSSFRITQLLVTDKVCDFILPLNPSNFLIRAFDRKKVQFQLARKTRDTAIQIFPDILKAQAAGIFSLDGMLDYNKELSRVIYLYRYRNQFLCLDSNLTLLYEGRTIDTNSTAKLKIATIKSDHTMTLAEPPNVTNKNVCTSGRYLFIESGLKADNETDRIFRNSIVIDVYDLTSSKYVFSFYLDRQGSGKVYDIKVFKNKLYMVVDNQLLSYLLPIDF